MMDLSGIDRGYLAMLCGIATALVCAWIGVAYAAVQIITMFM